MAAALAESTQMQISMQGEVDAKARNKDLKKTKMCIHHQRGMCGLGTNCPFAHALSEIREAPNLTKTQLCTNFMKGCCRYDNCTYAHGEAELVNPPSYKKKMCHWYKMGSCRNGAKCGFVHSLSEIFPEGSSSIMPQKPRNVGPPPGLKAAGSEYDYEASTNVPSSTSLAETDATTMSTASKGSMPDENLYRMMAGRGSAPLQHQVVSMGLAIADLQAKLSQVEGKMAKTQVAPVVAQMQQTSNQLVAQCKDMDAHIRKNHQQPAPTVKTAPSLKNARPRERSAPPLKDRSDAPPARKAVALTKPSAFKPSGNAAVAKKQQFLEQYGVRAALGVLVLALMAVVELTLNK